MAIIGLHALIYSARETAVRRFFQKIGWPSVDAGGGWPIFTAPPAELAVHPSDDGEHHELYLMCDDIDATVADLKRSGVKCGPIVEQRWGLVTTIRLPGTRGLGLYEPRHPTAIARRGGRSRAVRRAKTRR